MGNKIYRIDGRLYTHHGVNPLHDESSVYLLDIETGENVYLPLTDEIRAMLKSQASVKYVAYIDDKCELGKDFDGDVYLLYNNKKHILTSNPSEPCMYIKSDEREIILHNSFDVYDLPEFFQSHKRLESITGRRWDVKTFVRFCAR